jgi:hypothetical protein
MSKTKKKRLFRFGLIGLAVLAFACLVMMGFIDPAAAALYGGLPLIGFAGALSADRDTPQRIEGTLNLGVATAKKIYAGALVMRSATGYATPGAAATGCVGLGRAAEQVDNTSGADGAKSVNIDRGIFRFANSAAGDAIADADIGKECYIVDDQTVAKTDGGGTRSIAGRIFDVDSSGVWVEFAIVPRPATVGSGDMDATLIKYATVNLTNAEIKALRATPKELVAAQGANKVVEFVSALLMLNAGTNVLTESADNLAVKYENGSGAAVSQAVETTGFIDQAADTVTSALPKIDAIAALANAANKALVLHNTGDGEFAGNAANDAILVVKVAYRVHDLS